MLKFATGNEEETQAKERKRAEIPGKKEKTKPGTNPVPGKVPESTAPKQYMVEKGDSLNRIARENNIPLKRLLKLNRMGQKEIIHPGQVILVQ